LSRPGIIRSARRPPGWVPPGPRPAGDGGDDDLRPGEDEDLCFLTGDWRIFQRQDGHRWSMDDLVTAFVAVTSVAAPPARTLDIGCGIGSVLLSVAWAFPAARALGVEAQAVSAALCRRSVRYNGAAGRIEVQGGDLRDLQVEERFPLVTGTPPYFEPGAGTESTQVQRGPCRFEHRGAAEDYVATAARCLSEDGVFVICTAFFQAGRVAAAAAAHGLHVARRLDVIPRIGKAPLISIAVLGFAASDARAETVAVRDEHGQWTPWFREVRERMGLPPAP
jgi:tRNA1(Val) A37 N6-methylase TrmN6